MPGRWKRRKRDRLGPVPRPTPVPGSGLQVCRACRAPFVHPVARKRLELSLWAIVLRCGECRLEREVVVRDDVAARYEQDLRGAVRAIERALEQEDRERLARQADIFAAALDRDLIDAADFAR